MRSQRFRPLDWATAAATAMVVAAVALLAATLLGLSSRSGQDLVPAGGSGPGTIAGAGSNRTVAPAPPQSFSRPADQSRPFVPASEPRVLEAPDIKLKATVVRYTPEQVEANAGAVRPSSLWQVAWWSGGGTPGSHADNTVYLYGHTWKEPAVFNAIKDLERGDAVYVTTRTGRLRYVVDGSFTVPKADLTRTPTVSAAVPGRLLLLGCYRETGREETTSQNVVVIAHLA